MCRKEFSPNHFSKNYVCVKCNFSTHCKNEFTQHGLLSSCNPVNTIRRPNGRLKKPSVSLQRLSCSACKKFTSISFQELIEHMVTCEGSRIFDIVKQDEINDEELQELAHFGYSFGKGNSKNGTAKICNDLDKRNEVSDSVVKGSERISTDKQETIKKQFSEFLPLSKLEDICNNPFMVKHLLENEESQNNNGHRNLLKKIGRAIYK
ncbi:hypothetical protein Mgra_00001887 [Meloidogyne graminicola]|nr:hypothetical protein Mgra_00001887 [Meloidogyne graminicola]